MSLRRPSLHSVVAISLLCMGVLALALVLLSSWIYREVAYENRASAVQDLIRSQTGNISDELRNSQRIFALRLSRSEEFRDAWQQGDGELLAQLVETEMANADGADGGTLPLLQVRLLDETLAPIAVAGGNGSALGCPQAIELARQGVGNGISRSCLHEERAASTVLVPVSGLLPAGFIEVVADPVIALRRMAEDPDLAIRIERPGGRRLYESGQWATWSRGPKALTVRYLAPGDAGDPIFAVRAAADVSLLNRQLDDTRDFVLLAASVIVAGAILGALIMVRRMLSPLRALQQAAERVSVGGVTARDFQPVEARGPAEIATPIRSFNQMVERIGSLLTELEAEVGQRREAELAATDAKEEAEANALRASQEKEFSQITLESVVDAVIATDTAGRVNYMNPVAEHLTGSSEREARGRPIDDLLRLTDAEGNVIRGLVAACLEGEAPRAREERILPHPSGRNLHVEYSAVPMRDTEESVIGAVAVLHDVTEARMLTERLTYQATHDALTGLINRYEFEARLQQAVETCAAGTGSGVLCYLDLDQFKLVNDTCGHVAGDELLRQLATMMQDRLANRGLLARLGGDEFGLLIQPSSITEARTIADDLRDAVQRFRFVWAQSIFSIGVSIGLVEINEHTESTEMVLSAADTACYMAKDQGRNRVQVYEEDDEALLARHAEMHWVSEINRALEADRFRLYCQDIVRTQGEAFPTHFEILLRMRADDGRIWSPGAFLPAAERYNLAPAVDQWVVRTAMEWIAASDVPEEAVYSINLSGRSLTEHGFLDFLLAELDRIPVNPRNLCFEITETAAISNLSFARTFMESVRNRGCRFSLDDFGSGLSSFTYLKNLPVDFLKIDGSFVRDIHRDPVHYAMVRSMNEVGHAMKMETIAEFVEHEDVIRSLREIGVDFLQGFQYSRPRPLDPRQAEADLAHAGSGEVNPRSG